MEMRRLILSEHDLEIIFMCVEHFFIALMDHDDGTPEMRQRITCLGEIYRNLSEHVDV
jgi:hypothetical protein